MRRRRFSLLVPVMGLLAACGGSEGSSDAESGAGREIALSATEGLRFEPMAITASAGEKIVLVVSNAGRIDHELVIGDAAYLDTHAEGGEHGGHSSGDGGAQVEVPAGQTRRLTFTMPDGEAPSFACFVDRHDKSGMTGTVTYS